MKKVLIIVGDASETLDTLYPFYRLQEAGIEPVVAGPEQRTYQMVMHEVKPGWTITKEWEGYTIEAKIAFKDIVESDYAGIFFSGGRAPEYIREDPDLIRITQYFFDKIYRSPVFAMVWKSPPEPIVSWDVAWPPSPSASSISKFAEAPSWMNPAW